MECKRNTEERNNNEIKKNTVIKRNIDAKHHTVTKHSTESEYNTESENRKEFHDASTLAADLFVSEMIFDSRMGGRRIRFLLERHVILSLRELYTLSCIQISKETEALLSEQEWANIRSCFKDDGKKKQAESKAVICRDLGIQSVNRDDASYPVNLRRLEGMPLVLYWMGDLSILGDKRMPAVAVVGSRQPTVYGVSVTKEITKALVDHNICIISGLARGIDTIAHEMTLACGGRTVAVLAGGLDQVYPPENKELFRVIKETGLVLSEMPPGQKALRQYFPARNRILSGLSDLVAIMEAGEFSGTLHTASFAAAQGRDVFVVPGTIYAQQSRGNLKLIQDGADLLLSAEDILARLAGVAFFREMDEIRQQEERRSISRRLQESPELLTHSECMQVIIEQLSLAEQTMDELIQVTGFPFGRIAPLLSELELSGRVIGQRQRYALTFYGT